MTKLCSVCGKDIAANDIIVAMMLAKFKPNETTYDLEVSSQTILSHVFCVQKTEEVTNNVPA